jgi:hypothetical protein
MNNNEYIITDLNNINTDIIEICKSIKSSTLTTSTNNLLILIESITNNLKQVLTEGDNNEH